jgi:hypothetical protein
MYNNTKSSNIFWTFGAEEVVSSGEVSLLTRLLMRGNAILQGNIIMK